MTTLNEEIENVYTLPAEFLDEVRTAGLTIMPPSSWSFRKLQPYLENIYGLGIAQTSLLGKPNFEVYTSRWFGYGNNIQSLSVAVINGNLRAGGLKELHRASDGTLYLAVQYRTGPYSDVPPGDNRVNCIVITPSSHADHRQHNELKYSASGVLARILRPIADKVGLVIGPDKFSYKVTESGLGHTVAQEQEMSDVYASIVSMLLFNRMYPAWSGGYGYATVEALFERILLDCPVASPETIGLDLGTFEYIGDTTWLQDTMFNGLVQYAKTCPEHVKRAILSRDSTTTEKAIKTALAVIPSFSEEIGRAKSKAQSGITVKAAVVKVLTSLQGTSIPKRLHTGIAETVACGDNVTVVLGSSLDMVRGMALRAAGKVPATEVGEPTVVQTVVR